MATRIEIETALAQGNLWVLMGTALLEIAPQWQNQFWKTRLMIFNPG